MFDLLQHFGQVEGGESMFDLLQHHDFQRIGHMVLSQVRGSDAVGPLLYHREQLVKLFVEVAVRCHPKP
jgi:hypothetical protein